MNWFKIVFGETPVAGIAIDTYRDILDQTPMGTQLDASLTKTLKEHQHALRVQQEVHKLLQRYATPTKEPIHFEDAA